MSDELLERLREKRQIWPAQGGGTIGPDGATSYVTDDGYRLVNPDGPEAAAEITALRARVAVLEGAVRTYSKVHGVVTESDRERLRAALQEQKP